MRAYVLALAFVAACGGDEPSGPVPPPQPAAPPPTAAPAAGAQPKGGGLAPMRRIEDRVSCPTPSDAKKCDPKAPVCPASQYCVPAGNAAYCGPCPERDAIRHVFKPRDFQGTDIRDPFQSFVIAQPGLGIGVNDKPTEVTPKCTRKDQFVATSYNYQQLKLVGIVTQGTQRKVLMMGGNLGYIIKKGDCVGKEKALVKEISSGHVTFAVESAGRTDTMEHSMFLYPTQVSMNTPDAIDPGAASAPIVAPPSGGPTVAPPTPPAPPPPSTTTTVIQQRPEAPRVEPPKQAPTEIKP